MEAQLQDIPISKNLYTATGPKILILGHGGHGKDTCAELLAEMYGLTYRSSSEHCTPFVFSILRELYGYESDQECWQARQHHREHWRDLIRMYNSPDKSRLAREITETHDIYVGMRDEEEFKASRNLFTHIIWVDAAKRVPARDPSMGIGRESQFILIDNNGTKNVMAQQLRARFGGSWD